MLFHKFKIVHIRYPTNRLQERIDFNCGGGWIQFESVQKPTQIRSHRLLTFDYSLQALEPNRNLFVD